MTWHSALMAEGLMIGMLDSSGFAISGFTRQAPAQP